MVNLFSTISAWLKTHQLTCPVRHFLQIDCPGCGLQRSFIALLEGDINSSLHLHPATIPLLLFFIFAALQLFFKFKKGNAVIVYSYIFITVILVGNYAYKIIGHHLV